jgi:hypothetical protein
VGVLASFSGPYLDLHATADPEMKFSYARELVVAPFTETCRKP